ncbi:MAG: urease subunit alpha [Candidatus Nanopelagicales bacterium]|jgi:urease subunit alpha|nr:urease subunit alpha [Candidatus Nanopelagicales bacterium]MDP4824500.1 urease subunit alpha [Candidatus Nanopelagicales bacterium]MDP4888252.1 urease subunit alpha [Candidatus Nanopelagicales bacterium]
MSVYGPRAGDTVVLGGTGLALHIDDRVADTHDEFRVGFAKTGRDGIGLKAIPTTQSCDVVLSNAIVLDPVTGVRVASIGIKDGRISGVGKAGNPDTTNNIDVVVGSGTVVIDADGLIATPGGIDTHVHSLSPRVFDSLISSGITTVIAQETGPVWGVGIGSARMLRQAYRTMDNFAINIGLLGRGSTSHEAVTREAVEAHVCGFKVHEDTGTTLRTLDTALRAADEADVQVAVHTDSLNESLSASDTIAVLDGRVIHAYHVEGCGGGHSPDVLSLAGHDNILASSTNPTLPYGINAVDEHVDMIMLTHAMHADRESDVRIARARVRSATMAAENRLHDLGVIPITSSDAQGMGRAGETWWRTFALAAVMKGDDSPAEVSDNDNERILRYLAKITINPAITHGISHELGRLAEGYIADIVLWQPERFAAKPQLILKSGFPVWGQTGDPNASIDSAEPLIIAEQFGAYASGPSDLSYLLSNQIAVAESAPGTARRTLTVRGCRQVRNTDMVRHGLAGPVKVVAATSPMQQPRVTWRGEALTMAPVTHTPLSRLHFW